MALIGRIPTRKSERYSQDARSPWFRNILEKAIRQEVHVEWGYVEETAEYDNGRADFVLWTRKGFMVSRGKASEKEKKR